MRFRSCTAVACVTALLGVTPVQAAGDNRGYVAGMFGLDIDGSDAGWIMGIEGGEAETEVETSPEGNLTIPAARLLRCTSFQDTRCGPQQIIIDSRAFTNGSDDFDIIGFGYDPGNCCIYRYAYFPDGAFSALGSYRSIGPGIGARLNIAAIPEPASWTLLLSGFGAIGTSLRARRRTVSAGRVAVRWRR